MNYKRLFSAQGDFDASRAYRRGDTAKPGVYVYDEGDDRPGRIELAVNLALATGRPLLVRGRPGTGKSSLARAVADRLQWRYYEHVVSSRTQARDLLWSFDAVKRLSDAQVARAKTDEASLAPDAAYITPGVLWWAFDRAQAAVRGADVAPLKDPADGDSARAVVLIDEIDKADPDVPNDLLVPLGSLHFDVEDVRVEAEEPPLVIITTNDERDLPRAFLRRCVILELVPPADERLRQIARAHFPSDPADDVLTAILASYRAVQARQREREDPEASVAEFLDAVAASRNLGAEPADATLWALVEQLTLDKGASDA
jgi:MoxR-like ATPase